MTTAGGPFTDISGRMAVFGRLFGEQVGVMEPATLPDAKAVVAVVRSRVPRTNTPAEEAPIFEAAAYLGEWMRTRADATWIAEGPYEPHLQVADASHAIVYLLPLVGMLRTASTAGYDGMAPLLDEVLQDVATPAGAVPLERISVQPATERASIVAWVQRNLDLEHATRAALWRRCSACATMDEQVLTLHRPGDDWEGEAATAASILSKYPFHCPCGGRPGEVTRFLMVRHQGGKIRIGDIYVAGTHTRVGCWTLRDDGMVEPFDALALASDEMLG